MPTTLINKHNRSLVAVQFPENLLIRLDKIELCHAKQFYFQPSQKFKTPDGIAETIASPATTREQIKNMCPLSYPEQLLPHERWPC